ncbi:MAG: hypothetical protein ABJB09_06410 [Verrucomicrobiota bacterium]
MWKLFLAPLLFVTPALAKESLSAYEALRVVGTQLGRASMSHVISVSGLDGDPQPQSWKILLADAHGEGGLREFVVEGEQIVSQRTPNRSVTDPAGGAAIKTAQLNLDSTGAYAVASHTAETSHIVFTRVSYSLRPDERGSPSWVVTLTDQSQRPLGSIHIRANDGRVARVEGMYRGRNIEQVEDGPAQVESTENTDVVTGEDEDENLVKKDIKRMFRRTRDEARRIFTRVRRSFEDFFNRR